MNMNMNMHRGFGIGWWECFISLTRFSAGNFHDDGIYLSETWQCGLQILDCSTVPHLKIRCTSFEMVFPHCSVKAWKSLVYSWGPGPSACQIITLHLNRCTSTDWPKQLCKGTSSTSRHLRIVPAWLQPANLGRMRRARAANMLIVSMFISVQIHTPNVLVPPGIYFLVFCRCSTLVTAGKDCLWYTIPPHLFSQQDLSLLIICFWPNCNIASTTMKGSIFLSQIFSMSLYTITIDAINSNIWNISNMLARCSLHLLVVFSSTNWIMLCI